MKCPKCNSKDLDVIWDDEDILDRNANFIGTRYFILHAYCEVCGYEFTYKESKDLELKLIEDNFG